MIISFCVFFLFFCYFLFFFTLNDIICVENNIYMSCTCLPCQLGNGRTTYIKIINTHTHTEFEEITLLSPCTKQNQTFNHIISMYFIFFGYTYIYTYVYYIQNDSKYLSNRQIGFFPQKKKNSFCKY